MSKVTDMSIVSSYLEEISGTHDDVQTAAAKKLLKEFTITKPALKKVALNRENIQFLINEFEVEKGIAEAKLRQCDGNLEKAVKELIYAQ